MNRYFRLLTLLMVAFIDSNLLTASETAESEKTIRSIIETQAKAWNDSDLSKFMSYYWNSKKLTFSSEGKTTRGWKPTFDRYQRRYPTPEKMGHVKFDHIEVTILADSAAMVLGQWHLKLESENKDGNFTLVFRKIDQQWKIIHDHTSLLNE